MKTYIAWIKYENESGFNSVARGTLDEVETKAREIINSENWKKWANGQKSVLKITQGTHQNFVKSVTI